MNVHLLIIDPQNDFCNLDGSLYVPGADKDMRKLANFITNNNDIINKVSISLDCHPINHIGHPSFFVKKDSTHPAPFTTISLSDLIAERYRTTNPDHHDFAIDYLEDMSYLKLSHTIWPYHCVSGTWGAEIVDPIKSATKNMDCFYIRKGINPFREEFSAIIGHKRIRSKILKRIFFSDITLIAGEAGSHCVAQTILDICEEDKKQATFSYNTSINNNIYILKDTISPVPGYKDLQEHAFEVAVNSGMKIVTTEEMLAQFTLHT